MHKNNSNRLGLDYEREAAKFRKLDYPIVDVHTHINGGEAAKLYKKAARLYGVRLTYSMTHFEEIDAVSEVLGDTVRYIAMPLFTGADKVYNFGKGYQKRVRQFYERGGRIVKFWSAPRSIDIGLSAGDRNLMNLRAPHLQEIMAEAGALGMIFMTHIGDPDTWFSTKYADSARYGSKAQQYEALEEALEKYPRPWIAAHMGGWPEDLKFLSKILERHSNLYLDTSATKWMVRELSKHPRQELLDFYMRWRGRILFGSDIVTTDEHLQHAGQSPMADKSSNAEEAFDLYASRYWALRTLLETSYDGESPIADPDLAMVDPARFKSTDAPRLIGKSLPDDMLKNLYFEAADALLTPLFK